MRKPRNLVWLAIAMLLAALTAAGCGGAAEKPQAPAQPTTQQQAPAPKPANPDLILATTTSTQDSGLLDVLVPQFEQKTGYKVKTIAVGTGQALAMGERGEADVLLVHAPDSELQTVAKGAAVDRRLVMHNDFVFVGPENDPAGVKGTKTAAEALKQIAGAKAVFVSRGDDSGTHKMEQSLWKKAGVTPSGTWYQQSGSGMGQTLNIASDKNGYTLTDRATFLSLKKNLHLAIVLEKDPALLNIYHVMAVNPAKFSKVNADGAKAFADFLLSKEGQATIAAFGKDKVGEPLFFADGDKTDEQLAGKK